MSTLYAGCTALLSERNHQMCLVKLADLFDLYGTQIFAIDKITGEMYAVKERVVSKIDLQVYVDEGVEETPGAISFAPTNTSTPKDVEMTCKSPSQGEKPSELSTIEE